MTLVFTGVRVTLWYAALPGGATLEVHVDGKSTGQQIHTEAPELEVSASVDVVSGLDGAEHTLLLSVVHGSGSSLSISGFDVWHDCTTGVCERSHTRARGRSGRLSFVPHSVRANRIHSGTPNTQ